MPVYQIALGTWVAYKPNLRRRNMTEDHPHSPVSSTRLSSWVCAPVELSRCEWCCSFVLPNVKICPILFCALEFVLLDLDLMQKTHLKCINLSNHRHSLWEILWIRSLSLLVRWEYTLNTTWIHPEYTLNTPWLGQQLIPRQCEHSQSAFRHILGGGAVLRLTLEGNTRMEFLTTHQNLPHWRALFETDTQTKSGSCAIYLYICVQYIFKKIRIFLWFFFKAKSSACLLIYNSFVDINPGYLEDANRKRTHPTV